MFSWLIVLCGSWAGLKPRRGPSGAQRLQKETWLCSGHLWRLLRGTTTQCSTQGRFHAQQMMLCMQPNKQRSHAQPKLTLWSSTKALRMSRGKRITKKHQYFIMRQNNLEALLQGLRVCKTSVGFACVFSLGPKQWASLTMYTKNTYKRSSTLYFHPLFQVCLRYYEHEFVELACQCPAVVCCRCSPTQKAQIVTLLQQHTANRTCAIGECWQEVCLALVHRQRGKLCRFSREENVRQCITIYQIISPMDGGLFTAHEVPLR